jgi:hypothetical protein
MTTIESKQLELNATSEDLIAFVRNTDNLIDIFPKERIENWDSKKETCSFKIKGLVKITLDVNNVGADKIVFASGEGSPFDFTLSFLVIGNEKPTEGKLVFEGDMNPMLSMMATKPLTNFFNMIIENLQARYSS